MMLPALELPEGAEIRVAVVQAHLEEQGDNNEPSSLLVNVAMHPPRASQSVHLLFLLSREDYWYRYGQGGKNNRCFIACCWQRALQKVKLSARLKGRSDPWVEIWINK